MIAVITAPTKTPRYRFVVRRSKICFILFPAAASIPWLIIFIPYRKSAKPPNNDANSFAPILSLFFSLLRHVSAVPADALLPLCHILIQHIRRIFYRQPGYRILNASCIVFMKFLSITNYLLYFHQNDCCFKAL